MIHFINLKQKIMIILHFQILMKNLNSLMMVKQNLLFLMMMIIIIMVQNLIFLMMILLKMKILLLLPQLDQKVLWMNLVEMTLNGIIILLQI
jgi:hypothetical protein